MRNTYLAMRDLGFRYRIRIVRRVVRSRIEIRERYEVVNDEASLEVELPLHLYRLLHLLVVNEQMTCDELIAKWWPEEGTVLSSAHRQSLKRTIYSGINELRNVLKLFDARIVSRTYCSNRRRKAYSIEPIEQSSTSGSTIRPVSGNPGHTKVA